LPTARINCVPESVPKEHHQNHEAVALSKNHFHEKVPDRRWRGRESVSELGGAKPQTREKEVQEHSKEPEVDSIGPRSSQENRRARKNRPKERESLLKMNSMTLGFVHWFGRVVPGVFCEEIRGNSHQTFNEAWTFVK
jgi:hypothetical protein